MTPMISPLSSLPPAQFGEPQLHTDGDLLALSFAPDGSLWSVEEPGVLRHWNASTGQQRDWQALSDLETLWAFSADNRLLASASDDLTLWDTATGQVRAAWHQDAWVTALTFGLDSSVIASGHDDGAIRLWDVDSQQLLHEYRLHKWAISAVALSHDGALLAAAGEDKIISSWDTASGKLRGKLTGHTDRIPALAFHPSGEYLVSAGWDTTARVWSLRSQEPVILLNTHKAEVTALAFNHDGSRLASADSGLIIHVWDFNAKETVHLLNGCQGEIRCLTFSPDGQKLAGSGERMIRLWDTSTGNPLLGKGPRPRAKSSLAVSPSGDFIATNGGGSAPRIWDSAVKRPVLNLEETDIVHGLAYSPDGKLLAGAAGSHVRLWDAQTGKVVTDLDEFGKDTDTLAFSADSKFLAVASSSDQDVLVIRLADREPVLLIDDALDGCTVETMAFHPDGKLLAIGGIDFMATGGSSGAIILEDLEDSDKTRIILGGTTCVAFHPSGKQLASTSLDQSICIWDVETQEILAELMGHDNAVTCVAYSPDGNLLASGGEDRTVRLWDENGEERAVLEVDSQITKLAFSPDGRFLYTAHANTTCSQIRLSDLLK